MFTSAYRRCFGLATCLVIVAAAGCTANFSTLFNDEFLTELGVTQRAATVPGAVPTIVV